LYKSYKQVAGPRVPCKKEEFSPLFLTSEKSDFSSWLRKPKWKNETVDEILPTLRLSI
jgi:hypothetical protein